MLLKLSDQMCMYHHYCAMHAVHMGTAFQKLAAADIISLNQQHESNLWQLSGALGMCK